MSGHWNRTACAGLAAVAVLALACSKGSKDATLTEIAVSPATASIAKGTSATFVATAIYSNNTKQDVTAQATWAASDPAVLAFQGAGVAKGLAMGAAEVTATFQGARGKASLRVTAAEVVSLSVTPYERSIPKGLEIEFTATAVFTDQSVQDVTEDVQWSSSSPSAVICAECGHVKGVAEGTATITASVGGKQASSALEVTAAQVVSLALKPADGSLPKGLTRQLEAWALLTDESTIDVTRSVVWCEVDQQGTNVATVSNEAATRGLVTARNVGKAEICASYCNTYTARTTFTVTPAIVTSLAITPPRQAVPKGLTAGFAASAVYSDGTPMDVTRDVVWKSADEGIATISNAAADAGVATGRAVGSVQISAVAPDSEVQASATLDVTAAVVTSIAVAPAADSIPKGLDRQFNAVATMSDASKKDVTSAVAWESSDPAVAPVSNTAGSAGLAHGLAKGGPVEVRATYAGGLTAAGRLTVTDAAMVRLEIAPAANASIPVGRTQQFTAQAIFTDGTQQDVTALAAWSARDPALAVFDAPGLARGLAAGNVAVRAAHGGFGAEAPLEVRAAELTAVTVEPLGAVVIPKGLTSAFKATGHYTDGIPHDLTTTAAWTSSDEAVAQVSNAQGQQGVASGVGVGAARIQAKVGAFAGSADLEVTREELVSIRVTPPAPAVPLGLRQQFEATGVYTDQSEQDLTATVTWSSDPASVALVHNELGHEGAAETLAVGKATITATYPGTLKSASAQLEVTAATVRKVEITPFEHAMPKGVTYDAYQAWGIYTNGDRIEREDAIFSSSRPDVATVSNDPATKGRAFAVAVGETTISATLPDSPIGASTKLTITAAELRRVEVDPLQAERAAGYTAQFTATAVYTDGPVTVTAQADWISSDSLVASVDHGLVKARSVAAPTTVTITATYGGMSASAAFTSNPAVLVRIDLQPESPSTPKGLDATYQAIGTFSDDTTLDITDSVSWSSSDPAGAVLEKKGLFHGANVGTYVITAMDPATQIADTASMTVTEEELVWVEVLPPGDLSIPKGLTARFGARGWFTDGSERPYTARVTWSSDPEAIASFGCAACAAGEAKGLAVGTAAISALDPASGKAAHVGASDGPAEVTLTVTAAELTKIDVSPIYARLPAGLHQQFTAVGTFTDGDLRDVTAAVTWSSSDGAVAEVSNAFGSHGLATARGVGTATMTADFEAFGIAGAATFDVSDALLESLRFDPAPFADLPEGLSFPFGVVGHYTDGDHDVGLDPALGLATSSGVLTLAGLTATAGDCTDPSGLCTVTVTASLPGWDGTIFRASQDVTIVPEVVKSVRIEGEASMALGESRTVQVWADWSLSGTKPMEEAGVGAYVCAAGTCNIATFAAAVMDGATSALGDVRIESLDVGDGTLIVSYCASVASCGTVDGRIASDAIPIHVGEAVLYRLVQEPAPTWLPVGDGSFWWLKLTGAFSNGTRDLSFDPGTSWTTAGAVAIHSSAPQYWWNEGRPVSGMWEGEGTATASYGGLTATWTFSVRQSPITGLQLLEPAPIRVEGTGCVPFHPLTSYQDATGGTALFYANGGGLWTETSGPISVVTNDGRGFWLEVCGTGVAGSGVVAVHLGTWLTQFAVEATVPMIAKL